MIINRALLLLFSCVCQAGVVAATAAPAPDGPGIVGKYKAVFPSPPKEVPSKKEMDAPLMGNGDLLVALGGGPEKPQWFIGKNDLWYCEVPQAHRWLGYAKPMPLARLDLDLPGLKGASYRVEQDLLHGITTGTCSTTNASLTLESAVAATGNLLWVKLSSKGGTFEGRADLVLPGAPSLRVQAGPLTGGMGHIQLGREQYGQGRWYFNGAMDGMAIYDGVLSASEIKRWAEGKAVSKEPLRSWSFEDHGSEPGVKGKAMLFDGQSTFVDSSPLTPGKSITFGGFIKIKQHVFVTSKAYLISQGAWDKDWSLGISDGKLRFTLNGIFVDSENMLPVGQWVHVAGTYDGEHLRVFVDGQDTTPGSQQTVERRFEAKDSPLPCAAACTMRVVAGSVGDNNAFTVAPGADALIVVSAASLNERKDFREAASVRAASFKLGDLSVLKAAHEAWWRDYWSRSFVEIPDKDLERHYYLSQYTLGSASRLRGFAPDIFGWETTDEPFWGGAYYLNYNMYAPFYAMPAANHIAQIDPCVDVLLDAIKTGERFSAGPEAGIPGGILLPLVIGPKGTVGAKTTWHQKSDSSYACVPIASRWYATYDLEFARRAYPFVKGVAFFWEKWLTLEPFASAGATLLTTSLGKASRYVDRDDAIHELYGEDYNRCGQVNPLIALALIKQVMNLAIDMSTELGVDADRHAKWADIRDRLSDYPTCTVRDLPPGSRIDEPRTEEVLNLPIFKHSEKGPAWKDDNSIAIQHIFPGNDIGLDSSPDLLARARNTVRIENRWIDYNGCNSFYPAAARVGYDPKIILKNLRHWVSTTWPNGMIAGNQAGMEHFSVVPCTIQEMLFQSYNGVLRFFPCWPKEMNARFGTLRARGAFLVSAELKNGEVCGVRIVSEKGRDCTIVNPWPGKTVRVVRAPSTRSWWGGKGAEAVSGERFTLKTAINETLELKPE